MYTINKAHTYTSVVASSLKSYPTYIVCMYISQTLQSVSKLIFAFALGSLSKYTVPVYMKIL